MLPGILHVHEGLRVHGRVRVLAVSADRVSALELGLLVLLGAAAAAGAVLPDFNLRIPGHAILRSVVPLALGMALVPRRGSGVVMSGSALATALLLRLGNLGPGAGAFTSLCLTGPLLDLALARARRGWHVYLGLVLGGLVSNLAALLVRGGLKAFLLETPGARPAGAWFSQAIITYPVCGMLAGLLSALLWFQLRERRPAAHEGEAPA